MKGTDRLTTMLFPQGKDQETTLANLKFFPGDRANNAPEFRQEVQKAIHLVDSGICEQRSRFGDERVQVEIDKFLSIV